MRRGGPALATTKGVVPVPPWSKCFDDRRHPNLPVLSADGSEGLVPLPLRIQSHRRSQTLSNLTMSKPAITDGVDVIVQNPGRSPYVRSNSIGVSGMDHDGQLMSRLPPPRPPPPRPPPPTPMKGKGTHDEDGGDRVMMKQDHPRMMVNPGNRKPVARACSLATQSQRQCE